MRIERVGMQTVAGTGFRGRLPETLTVRDIEKVFGRHVGPSGDGKVTYQWRLRLEGEVVATIYDWRGRRWHVGGRGPLAVVLVARALGVEPIGPSPY